MQNMPLAKDVDTHKLAVTSEGYTGADIEAVCREAAMIAMRENIEVRKVKNTHFMKALETVRPSIDDEMISFYKEMTAKLGKGVVKREMVKGMEVL